MRNFSVFWDQNALDSATECWVAGSDRRGITRACDAIDIALASDPEQHGLPLHEGLWTIVVPPLVAVYSIEKPARIVIVHAVRFVRSETS